MLRLLKCINFLHCYYTVRNLQLLYYNILHLTLNVLEDELNAISESPIGFYMHSLSYMSIFQLYVLKISNALISFPLTNPPHKIPKSMNILATNDCNNQ